MAGQPQSASWLHCCVIRKGRAISEDHFRWSDYKWKGRAISGATTSKEVGRDVPFSGTTACSWKGRAISKTTPPEEVGRDDTISKAIDYATRCSQKLYPGSTTIKSYATRSLARFRVCGIRKM